jgi:uncharacterized protein (DUF1330 family)
MQAARQHTPQKLPSPVPARQHCFFGLPLSGARACRPPGLYRGLVTVYAIAQLAIHDRARYQRYVAAFMPILTQYGGRLLAADEHPEVTEGHWDGDKVVLIAFPDRETFTAWMTSPEYQDIASDRLAAAETIGILVRGLS